jgi:hypothetical protein
MNARLLLEADRLQDLEPKLMEICMNGGTKILSVVAGFVLIYDPVNHSTGTLDGLS